MAPIQYGGTDVVGYAYAAVLGFGGLLGALRRGSVMSLVAGSISSTAAVFAARKVSQDPRDVTMAITVAWTMCALMGLRFAMSWKFMPSGMIMVVSLLVATYYTITLAQ